MNKKSRKLLTVMGCTGMMTVMAAGAAFAQTPVVTVGESVSQMTGGPGTMQQSVVEESYRIWGTVTAVEDGRIVLDNRSETSYVGEMVLNIDPENTLVLDAVNGYGMPLENIKKGETIYAYIGPAMTLSLPPQTTPKIVFAGIPADFKVPDYITVESMTWNQDESWTLVSSEGTTYHIPGETPIIPYLTRQMITLADVTEGRKLLVWSNYENQGQKLVMFNQENPQ